VTRRTVPRLTATAAFIAVVAASLNAGPSAAAGPAPASDRSAFSAELLGAVQRDLRLTTAAATTRLAQEAKANEINQKLPGSLGDAFAGSYFDAKQGKLVVNITDGGLAGKVTAAGASPRIVKHTRAKLDHIMSSISTMAGRSGTSAARDRLTTSRTSSAVDGIVAWGSDPRTNTVHVTALRGRQVPALASLAGYGDAVTIDYVDRGPAFTAGTVSGGDPISTLLNLCSAGFFLRDAAGQGYLTTAGHCFRSGEIVNGPDFGTGFGRVLEVFPPVFGYDDAVIRNDNGGFWTQIGGVRISPPSGTTIPLAGFAAAPMGSMVCKSGWTTKLTCGVITGIGLTINYGFGQIVPGQTRHTACQEPGDSGGAVYSLLNGGPFGEGTSTGATLYQDGVGGRVCGARLGLQTESFYTPAQNSIPYYTSRYAAPAVLS
jgi:streptogrisin C